MIALLLGSFSVPVFTNIINSKKTFKTKVANIKCRLVAKIFNASCGTLMV